jgi:xeroderma pigmentosum group C-complementing protein
VIRIGQQPLKRVKARASTINKKREWEMMRERGAVQAAVNGAEGEGDGREMLTQGLYALWQTELYVADPVIDVSLYGCFPDVICLVVVAWLTTVLLIGKDP